MTEGIKGPSLLYDTNPEPRTFTFLNQKEDIKMAISAINNDMAPSVGRTLINVVFIYMAYFGVRMLFSEDIVIRFYGICFLIIETAVGLLQDRKRVRVSRKYLAKYLEKTPVIRVTADGDGFAFEDGTGRPPFRYAEGLRVYERKKVLGLQTSNGGIAHIPLHQLDPALQTDIVEMARRAGKYENRDPQTKGLFKSFE